MIFVENISDLEYFNPNQNWGCYGEPVFIPHDILLQAQHAALDLSVSSFIQVKVLKPDGTFIEDASSYFDRAFFNFTLEGVTYYYTNIRCDNYSPGMLSNNCFVLEVKIFNSAGTVFFHKYTQKYVINNTVVIPTGVMVIDTDTGNTATLCGLPEIIDNCGNIFIELLSEFDCIDTFTGDYYGDGNFLGGSGNVPFNFVRKCHIEGRLRKVPKEIKRTISLNCRTQRSETTPKLLLVGDVVFPVWKMEEIEYMLLANHLFINAKEYQTTGGTPFGQLGKPTRGVYVYKFELPVQECFAWQTFGCTPVCDAQTYYYPISL